MRPWTVIAFWAALLALWTAVQLLFSPPLITLALLGGAALAVFALALLVTRERTPREAPELSPATPVVALGAGMMVSGAELGTWCILLGALVTAVGMFALIGERR
jgi:hypothetical protein